MYNINVYLDLSAWGKMASAHCNHQLYTSDVFKSKSSPLNFQTETDHMDSRH